MIRRCCSQRASVPYNMCILKGFNTVLAKTTTTFFHSASGLPMPLLCMLRMRASRQYLFHRDQYLHNAAAQTAAGLQKWIFDAGTQQWKLAYTLQNGLNLGVRISSLNIPRETIPATGLPWAPATSGLAQHHRYREQGRHRDHLRNHLHGKRKWRPGSGSKPTRHDYRQLGCCGPHSACRGKLYHSAIGRQFGSSPRRVLFSGSGSDE